MNLLYAMKVRPFCKIGQGRVVAKVVEFMAEDDLPSGYGEIVVQQVLGESRVDQEETRRRWAMCD